MHIEIEKLKQLPLNKQVLFAYLICERLYPNYVFFSQNFLFGDIVVLRNAIDHIRKCLSDEVLMPDEIQQSYNDVYASTPDTDNFTTVHIAFALSSCSAILWTLKFLLDKQYDYLLYISRCGTDTADSSIFSNIEADAITEEVQQSTLSNPIMEKEISIQNEVISYLSSRHEISEFDICFLMKL